MVQTVLKLMTGNNFIKIIKRKTHENLNSTFQQGKKKIMYLLIQLVVFVEQLLCSKYTAESKAEFIPTECFF